VAVGPAAIGAATAGLVLEGVVHRLALSPDGKKLVGCGFISVLIWDVESGKLLKTLETKDVELGLLGAIDVFCTRVFRKWHECEPKSSVRSGNASPA
jgi:hypothetical protein